MLYTRRQASKLLAALPLGWSKSLPRPDLFTFKNSIAIGAQPNEQLYTTYGRPLVNRATLPSNTGVMVFLGQSNFSNVNPTIYTPANSTVYNFNIVDGGLYSMSPTAGPVLGTSTNSPLGYGCTCSRICDTLVTNGNFPAVVMVPAAVGGTQISQWQNDGWNVMAVTFARLASLGLTPNAVLWGQGESDTQAGTSQANYTAGLNGVISVIRAWTNAPIFIAQQSWNAGTTSTNVTNAQAAAVNHSSGIWAGPNADSLNATSRQGDNTHFNDSGAASYASLWITALHASGISPF